MAKDLPYFKFFVSEWNDGDITLEDYKRQGLFINVCSYYWSKECDVTSKLLYKKFKELKEDIDYLISEGHLKVLNGFIMISFLDEQKEERLKTSIKNSEAGRKGAAKRWKNSESIANAKAPLNGNIANKIREEKKKEEEISNIYKNFVEEVKDGRYDLKIESLYMRLKIRQGTLTPLLKEFKLHIIEEGRLHKTTNDFFTNFKNWLNIADRLKQLDKYR